MFRVVIVDDEPAIVEGLSKVFPWERAGCQVVGTAESAEEGLRVVAETLPDILIADICMAETDGLAMVAALRSEYPGLEVSILTGHRDFGYAQEAIRLGATRLLLKPSRMEELQEAVDAMVGKLRAREGPGRGEPQEPGSGPEAGGAEGGAGNFIVNSALAYIRGHYREKLRLTDVARQVYVSPCHLSKLISRHTGQSFSDIVNRERIERAKCFLREPGLRVGDVAELSGFLDVAHFAKVFKKLTGMSANRYRSLL
ncbi:MAG: response regulator [Clostridium sp.]|jgi:YesN/AraC family two-component response regulator|nr:response regulator [Clostridium sp.]